MTSVTPAIADPFFAEHHQGEPDERLARWRKRLLILLALGVAAWAVVAFVIGPPIVRSGYANASPIAAINDAFGHRHAYPLDHYLRKWNRLALGGLGAWLGVGGLVLTTTAPWFARRIVGTATPGTLGAIRVLTCLVLAYAVISEPVWSVVKLSPRDRVPMGVMDFIYADGPHARGTPALGFDRFVRSEDGLLAFRAITAAILLLAALGWKTRPMLIVGFMAALVLLGIVRSYSWLSHSGLLPLYVLIVLIVTRAGDGWSVDRLVKLWRNEPVAPAEKPVAHYAWARYAVWTVIAMQYVAAGLSKLFSDSWRWWEGVNLQAILYREALRPGHGVDDLILHMTWLPTWAFTVMGVMTIVIELGMALVLVSLVARLVWPILAIAMHAGIYVLQHILFWDWMAMQVVFYDWTKVRHWLGHRISARRGAIDVLYDGRCPICRRSVRLLRSWDLLDRLNYLDLRTLDVPAYNAHRGVTLDPHELEQSMHVIKGGRVTSGYRGCRTIAGALPIFWLIVPLLYLPGLSHLGAIGYRWLARNRMPFHTCDSSGACALPNQEAVGAMPGRSAEPAESLPLRRKLIGPLAIPGLICFLFGAWVIRLEWYPLTSVQMFSTHDNSGIVTYYKCYATDAFGNTYEAPLEKMGRGVSRYRPILSGGFYDAAGRQRCIEMLEFCGTTHNAANPNNPVVKLEVQKRRWDFVSRRLDPDFGDTVDRITVSFDLRR
ncbi:MAG TPA: DCC1-like thiol-disulfide oxidoreductase family protein [Tepidisphaeraceae bacterium]|nr:DCC1-like thiol-disulfide oxidoreductase family protein [Tepidisphaeraceae bacterium]